MLSLGGRLPPRVAAKLLLSAAIIDLMFLQLATMMVASLLWEFTDHVIKTNNLSSKVWAGLLNKDAQWSTLFCFIVIFGFYQAITETILGGRTLGRAILGLNMCDVDGITLRKATRMARGIRKLTSFGLSGFQITDLPRYDRSSGVFWHSRMVPRKAGPINSWRLIVEVPNKGQKSTLLGDFTEFRQLKTLKIGRDPERASLVVPSDTKMSSCHCLLSLQNGEWQIEDLNSTNGTFVNGKRIESNYRIKLPRELQFRAADVKFQITS